MALDRLRSLLVYKHKKIDSHAHSESSRLDQLSTCSPCSWSSIHDEYRCLRFLVWTGGAPGFTLTTSKGLEMTCTAFASDEDADLVVDRVTALKVWEAGVRPGDVLETVSGKRVHTMDTEAAIVLVQMSKSPSIIRFRSPAWGKRMHFNVHLGRQKLGVFFSGDGSRDVPIVTRVSQSIQKSKGDSANPSGVRIGDVLVAVNGKDAVTAGLNSVTKYLETCPRPLTLTFERSINEDSFDDWCSSQPASEGSEERRGRSISLQIAFDNMAVPALTREVASLRCQKGFNALVPSKAPHSAYPQSDDKRILTGHGTKVLIEWIDGPLGLTLVEDDISGAVIVNRLTGKGASANLERLHHGYELYAINGERTRSRTLDDLHQELLSLRKPVKLVFRPPESEELNEEDSYATNRSTLLSFDKSLNLDVGQNEEANCRLVSTPAAPRPCSEKTNSSCEQYEYEVVWTETQLGLQLEVPHYNKSIIRRQYPIVHNICDTSTLGLPRDAVGQLFVSVNNWSTFGLSAPELRTLLRVASRPAVLRFRRQEGMPRCQHTLLSDSSHAMDKPVMHTKNAAFGSVYSILWSHGKLGILFASYEETDHQNNLVVYVKRIGPGQAQSSKLVAVGDILMSIDGQNLAPKQTFKKTMRLLSTLKQPATLMFRRLLIERSSEE